MKKKPFDQDKQDISVLQPADVETLTEKIQQLEIENRRRCLRSYKLAACTLFPRPKQ